MRKLLAHGNCGICGEECHKHNQKWINFWRAKMMEFTGLECCRIYLSFVV